MGLKEEDIHPATRELLHYFGSKHLPVELQSTSAPFLALAWDIATRLEGPEVTAGLRKLLEAKDCFVRAALRKQD